MALTREQIDALDIDTLRELAYKLNEWTCGEERPCSQGDGFVCNEWKEYAKLHGLDPGRDKKEYYMEYFFFPVKCECMCALEYELWKLQQAGKERE